MPRNMIATRAPIMVRVIRALAASGRLKAGTPFETASTPVIALQPSAKARITSRTLRDSRGTLAATTPVTCGASPIRVRLIPTAINPRVATTKT